MIARLLYILNINGTQGFKWIEFVKSTFDETGLSFMYSDQQYASADWLKTYAKQILRDLSSKNGIMFWQIRQGDNSICHLKVILLLNLIY
jgi:hypothetical protein